MKSLRALLLILLTVAFFASCSDDSSVSNPEDNTDNLLPMKSGNNWIYFTESLDSNNIAVPGSEVTDSTFVSGTEEKLGKTATILSTVRLQGTGVPPEQYYYTESSKIYAHSTIIENLIMFDGLPFELPITIPEQWFLLINPNADTWDVAIIPVNDDTVAFSGFQLIMDGTLSLKGKKAGTETIQIGTVNHKSHKYTITINFDFQVKLTVPGNPVAIEDVIKFDRDVNFWFVNNIGNVRIRLDSKRIKLPVVGTNPYPGYETDLLRYYVTP
jgi:hypothetical protein